MTQLAPDNISHPVAPPAARGWVGCADANTPYELRMGARGGL